VSDPASHLDVVAFDGPACRPLVRPPALPKEFGDVIDVVTRAEVLENHALNPLGGPELRGVARLFGPASQQPDELPTLTDRQLGWAPRPGLAPERDLSLSLGFLQPLADGGAAHPELPGDICLGNALSEQNEGLETTVFEGDGISSLSHEETIPRSKETVK
jgi:hypothetical protein